MTSWLVIARRELSERLRSRWFVATTLLGPLLLVGAMAIPVLIAQSAGPGGARVVVLDAGSGIGERLVIDLTALGWRASTAPATTPDASLLEQIADDRIDGFLRLPVDLVTGNGAALYQGDNASNQQAMGILGLRLRHNVTALRLEQQGMRPGAVQVALRAPGFETRHTTGRAEGASGELVFVLGYIVVMMLYMAIVIYAVNVMRAVVMEKSNKVVEVLLAAAKPHALMLGKIVGVGAAGLLQVSLWALVLFGLTTFGPAIFGAPTLALPSVDLASVLVIVAYFVLGYFFFASLYAAIGAMVSSEQEAQQAQGPIVMLLIIPIACIQLVANDPRGTAAEVLTQIPFTSPFLMPMRFLLEGTTPWSLAGSLALLALSTWLMARLATRIFRVGILMTGKRPTLRELWRWIRHPM